MIDFTLEATQSLISTTSSDVSNSMAKSTGSSESESFCLRFITEDQKTFDKLVEDLSIIDSMSDTFDYDLEISTSYDQQVLDIARQVALKRQVLDQLLQSEAEYLDHLLTFHKLYTLKIQPWLINTTDRKDILAKFTSTAHKVHLQDMFQNIHTIAMAHKAFLADLRERVQLWGPTQLISDIFSNLYCYLNAYKTFMQNHADYVVALDALCQLPPFMKLIQSITENDASLKDQDIVHCCLYVPLHRLPVYNRALNQLKLYSNPIYPDYTNLHNVTWQFQALEKEWSERVQGCQSHLMVLEAFRAIESCPIQVTYKRRLLLFAHLIKVDLDDITLTTDMRTYFLYNDALIYCKKLKGNKKSSSIADKKLTYKGTLNLRGADIRQLAPSFCAKMCQVKKPLFRIGKRPSSGNNTTNLLPSPEAFGFEVVTSETNMDAMSPLHQNYQSAMVGAGAPILRRHVVRTKSYQEQKVWFEAIRQAITLVNAQEQ